MRLCDVGRCLTCGVLIAVLDSLASCYMNQQMFTKAEALYQTEISLLKEIPGDETQNIATGQTCGSLHCVLYTSTVLLVCFSIRQLGSELLLQRSIPESH